LKLNATLLGQKPERGVPQRELISQAFLFIYKIEKIFVVVFISAINR